ncbi:uncharacterized protein YgbK (DUF1537 family) [Kibdelosporangium banguiense]|uniref:Uncharacterized protein YgbK (DUF1537 family) n=1 Tax=Kibdelosporangium banguiense TaxID=1365924 RepID=A0ABS4THG5_9PSEU|nr:hypothetical protein [Kibdelosporangium banguiense]MBP2323303.1 uncharacterized protein YgbK (DUF1537 family) [Kibdelosporangium banguiense]
MAEQTVADLGARAIRDAYEQGRQDFAQEALDDLTHRGFSIALWQSHTRHDIRRWLNALRNGQKWSDPR